MLQLDKVYNGDCFSLLHQVEDESIDLIATDPPYGIEFMGKDWDKALPPVEVWAECLRVLKPGAFAFVLCTPRQDSLSRMIIRMEDAGFMMGFTSIYWAYASGFPKAADVSSLIDKRLGEEREVVKTIKKTHFSTHNTNEGWKRDSHYNEDGEWKKEMNITKPKSDLAKKFENAKCGFQLKPAVEIVIVGMKPLEEKTYVDQALSNQKGITWLDEGRIPFQSEEDKTENERDCIRVSNKFYAGGQIQEGFKSSSKGRFPANLIVEDDCLDDGFLSKSNIRLPTPDNPNDNRGTWQMAQRKEAVERGVNDEGTFSRYFSLDSWWSSRIDKLPPEARKTFPFLIVPKPSKAEKNEGLDGFEERPAPVGNVEGRDLTNPKNKLGESGMQDTKSKNIHPTTKPLKLMSWLITLGSREKDTVLDMFMGSGTTGVAAHLLGREFIGIEIESEYFKIAEARIKEVRKQRRLEDWNI